MLNLSKQRGEQREQSTAETNGKQIADNKSSY